MNAKEFAAGLPRHINLALTHNEQKASYQTVAKAIEYGSLGFEDWVSDEQRTKAIESDECWTLHWYPDNPVGFYRVSAADLDVLLDYVQRSHE